VAATKSVVVHKKNKHSHVYCSDAAGRLKDGLKVTATNKLVPGSEWVGKVVNPNSLQNEAGLFLKCTAESRPAPMPGPRISDYGISGVLSVTLFLDGGGTVDLEPAEVYYVNDPSGCSNP